MISLLHAEERKRERERENNIWHNTTSINILRIDRQLKRATFHALFIIDIIHCRSIKISTPNACHEVEFIYTRPNKTQTLHRYFVFMVCCVKTMQIIQKLLFTISFRICVTVNPSLYYFLM